MLPSTSLNLPRSPRYFPVRFYLVSLHRRRFFRRSGKRKRDHCDRGNRERRWQWRRRRWVTEERRGEERRGTSNAISHAVEAILSRQTPRKSPPGIFAAGHLRAEISSPEIRENWERRRSSCVRSYMCVVVRRSSACTCEAQRYEGYFSNGISGGSEGSRGSIDRRPIVGADQRRAATSRGENASHIRYPRYVYCGTFIARKPRRVIDKRVHLLSRLIKFGKGWVA